MSYVFPRGSRLDDGVNIPARLAALGHWIQWGTEVNQANNFQAFQGSGQRLGG